jgi:tRNA (uracil-5-)-methyltransferase
MRAEFRVWHEGDDLFHVMFDQGTKQSYRVDRFPPASQLINTVMPEVISAIKFNPILRHRLFQIDYLSSTSDQIVITLSYHRPLNEEWHDAICALRQKLSINYQIDFIGRARKQKWVVERDFVLERLTINQRAFTYKQVENSFTQPNARVNCNMIQWAIDVSQSNSGDLLELYCGAGNFTLPLSFHFPKVLATEISKSSVAAAHYNIGANNIQNVKIIRLSSEELVEAMLEKREFRRLEHIKLTNYDCQTVLVDPPRAGVDEATISLIRRCPNIIYISCNLDTLTRDLDQLLISHQIKRIAFFDQFPYTHHAEYGVYLEKN